VAPGHFWTAFLFAVVPFLILLGGLWWIDRYEKEPARLLVLGLVFGAVVAPLVAYGIEEGLDLTTSFSSQLIVPKFQLGVGTPLVEELVRAASILIVFLLVRSEIDDILDGIIYGGVVGVGFGAAANFVSIWKTPALDDAHASLYAAIVTGLNHVFYGALIGLALALVRKRRSPFVAAAVVVGAALAFGFHVLHDYLPWLGAASTSSVQSGFGREFLTQLPNYFGVFILGLIAIWASGRERLIVARALADEIANGTVTANDYHQLVSPLRRAQTLALDFLWRGERVWRLRRRLYATEVELAFRKYHRGDREQTQSRAYGDEGDYRTQIRDLRTELAKYVPGAAAASRRTAARRPAANALLAGTASLICYLALVGVFVLIWYLAFQPGSSQNVPAISGGATPLAAPPSALVSASTASGRPSFLATSGTRRRTIEIFVCSRVRLRRCIGTVKSGGSIPSQSRSFIVVAQWRNLKPRDRVSLSFSNDETRQPVANDRRFRVVRRTDYGLASFDGPFPRMELVVTVSYNGALVEGYWLFKIV
jgi:RsiW-degrading membrane proteinase PrsW (M82 family)